ncbi:MAG TPA: S9 family peptidase, partial [Gammaproteobacteria bacterium]
MKAGIIAGFAALQLLAGCDTDENTMTANTLTYPTAERGAAVDDYRGTAVADPYRWMEDLDSTPVKQWVDAQNALAGPYLEAIPSRQPIIDRMTALWNYERYDTPFKEGGHYFYSRNDGLQNHDVLYVTDSLDAPARVLLDPNALSEDGTVSVSQTVPDPSGALLAYSVSDGGSDWRQWRVRNIDTGEDLPDLLVHTKFTGVSWSRDGSGFFYSRYPLGESGQADDGKPVSIYYHEIGAPQSDDREVYALPNHDTWNPYGTVTEDGRYLVITVWDGYFT